MKSTLFIIPFFMMFDFMIGQQVFTNEKSSLQKTIFKNVSLHQQIIKPVEVLFLTRENTTFAEDKFHMMFIPTASVYKQEEKNYTSFEVLLSDFFLEEMIVKEFLEQYNVVLGTAKAHQKNKKIKGERNKFLQLVELYKNKSIQTGNSIEEKSDYLTTLDEVLLKYSLNLLAINLN